MLQELRIDKYADVLQNRHAWVKTLLRGATGLTALSTSTDTLPRSPMLYQLHLCHLELMFSGQIESRLLDISCCLTLESLAILEIDRSLLPSSPALPMDLHNMPRLKHVRLVDCFVLHVSLPAECSLFLEHKLSEFEWHESVKNLCSHTIVLRLGLYPYTAWPIELRGCLNLDYLELRVQSLDHQDLADLQHINHVRIVSSNYRLVVGIPRGQTELQLTSGSWQSLEVYFFGELHLVIKDIDSFVRDMESFTFSSEDKCVGANRVYQEILDACKRHGKACHLTAHKAVVEEEEISYSTLSTRKEVAGKFPIIYDDNHEEGPAIGLWGERTICHGQDFWPSDPCASVKRA